MSSSDSRELTSCGNAGSGKRATADSGSLKRSLSKSVRLQKYLAACGVASRRASEQYIADGRVSVNGRPVTQQGFCLDPESDTVEVDGRRVFPEPKLYYMFNKPVGVLCTCQDTHGRKTFLDYFPNCRERLYPVGRLDQDSEGLLIVTNDGALALHLTHPRHEVAKTYWVRLTAPLSETARSRMLAGIESEGEILRAESISPLPKEQAGYRVVLKEGRKRQIRRMAQSLGLSVLTLQRVAVGSLTLGILPTGKARALSRSEIDSLLQESNTIISSQQES